MYGHLIKHYLGFWGYVTSYSSSSYCIIPQIAELTLLISDHAKQMSDPFRTTGNRFELHNGLSINGSIRWAEVETALVQILNVMYVQNHFRCLNISTMYVMVLLCIHLYLYVLVLNHTIYCPLVYSNRGCKTVLWEEACVETHYLRQINRYI